MQFNPVALAFFAFCSGVGYLIGGDIRSMVIGLVSALGVSILFTVLSK